MEIYSMLVYNTIFFAECQDGNGFLFHFINFAQTPVIFYSKLTSKNIPFLDEVSIGHALICDALYLGLQETIKQYKACLEQ